MSIVKKYWALAVCCIGIAAASAFSFSTGAPTEHTGSYGEPSCSECHSTRFGDQECTNGCGGDGAAELTVFDADTNEVVESYIPEHLYVIRIRVIEPEAANIKAAGFSFSVHLQTGGHGIVPGGEFSPGDPANEQVQIGFNHYGIRYATHTRKSAMAAPSYLEGVGYYRDFFLHWKAPDYALGVLFGFAGMSSDADGLPRGDRTYAERVHFPRAD